MTSWNMKKLFSVSVTVAFLVFMGLAVAVSLSAFSVGGSRLFTVMSGSMEPTIHTGSLIFVFPADTYEVGDIVTRTTDKADVSVTHRIAEKTTRNGQTFYRTKGDANGAMDGESVPESSLMGTVRFVIPWLGFAVNFAKTELGFVLLILIPAVIIIYEECRKIRDEIVRMWHRRQERRLIASIDIPDDSPTDDRLERVGSFLRDGERNRRRIV